ncbi:MAG: M23 family metallopeptidase [Alphaproteobacteria bacterium]|nr:MAG: M23 family metallopeptidase [Alphaproteobacteria bacterium]
MVLKFYRNILIAFFLLSGCDKGEVHTIIVKENETLDSICEKYNVTKDHIMKKNQLTDSAVLKPGQVLKFSNVEKKRKIINKTDDDYDEPKLKIDFSKANISEAEENKTNLPEDTFFSEELKEEIKNQIDQIAQKSNLAEKTEEINSSEVSKPKVVLSFPTPGGKIDKSRPFSNKHVNRQEGSFIIYSGDVLAVFNGEIVFVDYKNSSVYIKNDSGWVVTYRNLDTIVVAKGDTLSNGEKIGTSADEIFVRVWNGTTYLDPELVFSKSVK